MKDELIHISPKQILSYLCDFERKLPKPSLVPYEPTLIKTPLKEYDLNAEALNMMKYLGLNNYTPKCTWKYEEDGTGGSILLDDNINHIVKINVSIKYQNNIDAVLAILAHEVCHKFLFVHGIYWSKFNEYTEISTDLCTIYVGFGDIIQNGYVASKGKNKQILGYLELTIYARTRKLIDAILWGKEVYVHDDWLEPYLQRAHNIWKKSLDKKSIVLDSYKESLQLYSKCVHNVEITVQLLQQYIGVIDSYIKEDALKLYNEEWIVNGCVDKPFAAFSGIYSGSLLREKLESDFDLRTILNNLNCLIHSLFCAIEKKELPRTAPEIFHCPFCKKSFSSLKLVGKNSIIKCPSCKCALPFNGLIINKKEVQNIHLECDNTILKHARDISFKEGFAECEKQFDELIKKSKSVIEDYNNMIEKNKDELWCLKRSRKKLDCLNEKIERLPKWLKFLIGDKLKYDD